MTYDNTKIKYLVYCFPLFSDGIETTIGDIYDFQSEYQLSPRNKKTFVTNEAILKPQLFWCDYAK